MGSWCRLNEVDSRLRGNDGWGAGVTKVGCGGDEDAGDEDAGVTKTRG